MTGHRLLLAGDAGTGWEAIGRWTAQAFELPGGHSEPTGAEMADAALRANPADRLLYFAGRPEHALRGHTGAEPATALGAWAERARAVLRVAHAHPGRCLLVDIDDARQRPVDLLASVADWLEATPQPTVPPPAPDADSDDVLWRQAASACVESRATLLDLAQEWLASCIPLGPPVAPATAASADADDALQVLIQLRTERATSAAALQRTVAELMQQRSAHDAEQALRHQLEADLVLQRRQIDQLLEDGDALRRDLDEQAHGRQENARRAQGLTVEKEALAAELRTAQAAQAEQAQQLAATADALEHARQQRQAKEAELQAALDAHRAELAALHTEQESLMSRLLQAHSDAAAAHALAEEPAAPGGMVSAALGVSELPLAGIALAHVRDEPPHRELHFQLSGLLTPKGEWPELEVRLVDHEGRPGLTVFGDETRPPFSGWRRTGDEAGRGYMLIIPTDVSGPAALTPLPASDWAFLRSLANLLLLAVEEPDFGLRPAWRQVAARLSMQLDSVPPRLRYDALDVHVGDDGRCLVHMVGVSWGTRSLPDLALRWRPAGAQGPDLTRCALAWVLPGDPDAPPPLTLWPEAEDGSLQPAWALAVGPGFDAAARRRWWAAQPAADRELLLAVLDALPAAADAAGQPAWRGAARALHVDARKTLRALRLRALVRRLRRR